VERGLPRGILLLVNNSTSYTMLSHGCSIPTPPASRTRLSSPHDHSARGSQHISLLYLVWESKLSYAPIYLIHLKRYMARWGLMRLQCSVSGPILCISFFHSLSGSYLRPPSLYYLLVLCCGQESRAKGGLARLPHRHGTSIQTNICHCPHSHMLR
jgi:hypothetical protein